MLIKVKVIQNPSSMKHKIWRMSLPTMSTKPVMVCAMSRGGLRPGKTQTGLLAYKRKARVMKFQIQKLEILYYLGSEQQKGADQTAQIRKLICTFVVRLWHKVFLSMTRLVCQWWTWMLSYMLGWRLTDLPTDWKLNCLVKQVRYLMIISR